MSSLKTTNILHPSSSSNNIVLDSSGRTLLGTSSARANFFNSTFSPLVQIEGANNDGARLQGLTYGRSASSDGPVFVFGKFRDNTVGGTSVVASGDQLGWISFQGMDGTQFVECASIRAEVDATPGADDMPGRLVFSVTADGTSVPNEALRITNDRNLRVTQAPGKYTISTSDGATSIANNGTVDFATFSGLVLITNHSNGYSQMWLTGAGSVSSIGTVNGTVGSLAYNAGIDGYRWTNNYGSTATFGFFCVRTRPNA